MAATSSNEFKNQPFSFTEILAPSEEQAKPEPVKLKASDGVELSVTIFEPTTSAGMALVFYHGGGAYSGAGYQYLARGLAEDFGITVYLPDIRGHGTSGGARGDAPSKEQVWYDVDTVLEFVAKREPSSKLILGGHSSGGGLVVNYATYAAGKTDNAIDIEGYILVSPELGYLSKTARPDRREFAKVNILAFIANGIFGVLGNSKAVKFQYPAELLEADDGLVAFNTVNMANAITPETPKEQMQALGSNEKKPLGLWVGSDDELFVAEKVADFVPNSGSNTKVILPGKNHLGILVGIHEQIGAWMTR